MLIALLILIGTAVALLFFIWLTGRVFYKPSMSEILLLEEESGTQNPPGTARDINEPGIEELNDLQEPDVKDQLAAVTDAVSTIAASLDALEGVVATRGKGMGDSRKRGNGDDVIPRWQRWEIRYESTTLADYAKQLGFFNIELGVLGGGRPGVDYLGFAGGAAKKRTVNNSDDERLYFIWQSGKFKEQDRQLLAQNGIPTSGRVMCQFYSKELENRLANLELQKRGNRPLKDIKKTFFGITGSSNNYEFYVMDIRWR